MSKVRRIILSRKGFDSKAGGGPSLILKDRRIFSIPIPQSYPSPSKYKDLIFDGVKMTDLLSMTSTYVNKNDYCHFDPYLNKGTGIFGQAGSSQSELNNNRVLSGDLFLFFGWFKDLRNKKNIHHLFGWLQIDLIIKSTKKIKEYLSKKNIQHPHGYKNVSRYKNNTLYIAKKNLEIENFILSKKGHGLFKKTHRELILSEFNMSRSRWKFPKKYFINTSNIFLNRLKWDDEMNCRTFYKGFGQEFILNAEDNPTIVVWAKNLIEKHG